MGDVQRYEPVHDDAMAADADGRFVTFADYAKLRAMYAAAWEECEWNRSEQLTWAQSPDMPRIKLQNAHDTLRKEAGL